jgi:hypothetical protein
MTLTHPSERDDDTQTASHDVKTKRHYYRRFNQKLSASIAIPMLMAASINIVIDPYDFWSSGEYQGINHIKPSKDNSDRLYKAVDIIRQQPSVVILGSSRAKQGIDPSHELFQAYSQDAYNLAINGPNIYEVRRYLEHFLANQKHPELIVLGIDFFMFNQNLENQPSFDESRLGISHLSLQDVISTTLSVDALQASWETFQESRQQSQSLVAEADNGFAPNRNAEDGQREWRFENALKLYFDRHSEYSLSDDYLNDLKRIVELSEQYDIPLYIFISPAHATQWEAIRTTGEWATFEEWKRQVVAITPVWDFSGYNSVTTEKIAKDMDYYTDSSHYSVSVGNWVITRILQGDSSNIPEDFGKLVDAENIEQHLAQIRADHDIWASQNQETIDWVLTIQAEQ